MEFKAEARISHNADTLVNVLIDELERILPFVEPIDSLVTKEKRELADGRVEVLRHWQGNSKLAPAAVRPLITRKMLFWIDNAVWSRTERKVEWEMSTSLSKFYSCKGTNYFEPDPDDPEGAAWIRISGDLTLYADKLPGVPKRLGRKFAPRIERFVIKRLRPHLLLVADGLQGYLDDLEG